jgi:cellulose synthase operon protein C
VRGSPWILALALCLLTDGARAFVWPNAVERIEKQLHSSDPAARREAAAQLGELPVAVARRLIPAALDDPEDEVRLAAAEAAVALRLPGVSERVIPWLSATDRRMRLAAAELLALYPTARATATLGRVLGDPDQEVRIAAATALGASGDPAAAMPLLGHLDDTVPEVQARVVGALARLGDPSAVVPLIGKVQHPRPTVRLAVVQALGKLGDARAASALVLALRDTQGSVRVAALVALGQLRASEATAPIAALLVDQQDEEVREAALRALARIGTPEALQALLKALETDDPDREDSPVRAALHDVGRPVVARLVECLVGQPSATLADSCALALGELEVPEAPAAIVDALRRGVVRPQAALRALAACGSAQSLSTVLEYLSDPEPRTRRAAIDAATQLLDPHHPDGRATDPIRRALEASGIGAAERAALVSLLGRTGSPRAAKVLAPIAAEADDVMVRVAAIEALGLIGPAGQDRALIEALDADEASVRWAAAVALRRSASGAAARALLDRLEREAERDRAATAIALGGALSRCGDGRMLSRAFRLLQRSSGAERDALIEAVGLVPGADSSTRLLRHAAGRAPLGDRAKVAEVLASDPEAVAGLERLARDVDGSVRANAVWSLGAVGGQAETAKVTAALQDRDVAVAGNAAAALGRIGARTHTKVGPELCRALGDPRSYVRANALLGLAVAQERCGSGDEVRRLLQNDPAPIVRRAAARLLHATATPPVDLDRRALERCTDEDPDGSVAAACSSAPAPLVPETDPLVVYVVPIGEASPVPRAPFALVHADGLMRLGVTDRRGALFEPAAPRGEVTLEVPAPLAR